MIHGSIDVVPAVAKLLAMALGSGAVAAGAALLYRWYSGQSIPEGVAVLLGVSVVALALNTTATLQDSVAADEIVGAAAAGYTLAAFVVGAIAADAGRRFGERLGGDLPSVDSVRTMESDVGSFVRGAGRVLRVRIPESIEDIDGYEPVPRDVKDELAGTVFRFPRRMTVAELRERFVERLKRDYEVGHVDVEFAEDGTVEYLALGRRLAGLGQTLAPGTVAVAIRADPAFSATPGDRVQIWRNVHDGVDDPDDGSGVGAAGGTMERGGATGDEGTGGADGGTRSGDLEQVATGELRAAVEDVATIAVDGGDADRFADDVRYRLVTLPAAVQPDREFASLLRNADETMGSIAVGAGSELDGLAVEAIDMTVAAVRGDGDVTAIPPGDRTLRAGETVYVVGRPERIRQVEARGRSRGDGTAGEGEATDGSSGGATAASSQQTDD